MTDGGVFDRDYAINVSDIVRQYPLHWDGICLYSVGRLPIETMQTHGIG